jgi:hypothetical protein
MTQSITFNIDRVIVTQFKFANDAIRMELNENTLFPKYQALMMYVENGKGVEIVKQLFDREPDQIITNY